MLNRTVLFKELPFKNKQAQCKNIMVYFNGTWCGIARPIYSCMCQRSTLPHLCRGANACYQNKVLWNIL